jgi:hypothetical protein
MSGEKHRPVSLEEYAHFAGERWDLQDVNAPPEPPCNEASDAQSEQLCDGLDVPIADSRPIGA